MRSCSRESAIEVEVVNAVPCAREFEDVWERLQASPNTVDVVSGRLGDFTSHRVDDGGVFVIGVPAGAVDKGIRDGAVARSPEVCPRVLVARGVMHVMPKRTSERGAGELLPVLPFSKGRVMALFQDAVVSGELVV